VALDQGFYLTYNESFNATFSPGTTVVRATVVHDNFTTKGDNFTMEGYPHCDSELQVVPSAETAVAYTIGIISTGGMHREVVASGSYSFINGAVLPPLTSDLLHGRFFLVFSAPAALDFSFSLEQVANSSMSFNLAAVWCTDTEEPTPPSKFGPWETLPRLIFRSQNGTSSSTLDSVVEATSFVSNDGTCLSIRAATAFTSNPTVDMFRDVGGLILHDIVVDMRPFPAFADMPPSVDFRPAPASLAYFDIDCMLWKKRVCGGGRGKGRGEKQREGKKV
jgi:hypothetical protein